jgi:hypothetical protein
MIKFKSMLKSWFRKFKKNDFGGTIYQREFSHCNVVHVGHIMEKGYSCTFF